MMNDIKCGHGKSPHVYIKGFSGRLRGKASMISATFQPVMSVSCIWVVF